MNHNVDTFREEALRLAEDKNADAIKGLVVDYYRKGILSPREIFEVRNQMGTDRSESYRLSSAVFLSMIGVAPDLLRVTYEEGFDVNTFMTSGLVSAEPSIRFEVYKVVASESTDEKEIAHYLGEMERAIDQMRLTGEPLKAYSEFLKAAKNKSNEQLERVAKVITSTLDDVSFVTLDAYLMVPDNEWSWDIGGALIRNTDPNDVISVENGLNAELAMGNDVSRDLRRLITLKNMDV